MQPHTLACQAIGAIGPGAASAVPDLVKFVENVDRSNLIRYNNSARQTAGLAVLALGAMGPIALPALIALSARVPEVEGTACVAIEKMGPQVLPTLIPLIPRSQFVCRAVEGIIRHMPNKSDAVIAVPALIEALKTNYSQESFHALEAIGYPALPALREHTGFGVRSEIKDTAKLIIRNIE